MMKRMIQLLTAVFLLGVMAGPAVAHFENSHLVLVVYNDTDNEVAVDLGGMDALSLGAQDQEIAPPGSVEPPDGPSSQFGVSINEWGDLRAAYFTAYFNTSPADMRLIFATTSGLVPNINSGAMMNFLNGSVPCHTYWNGYGTRVAVGPSSDQRSYDFKLNGNSTTPGYMGGFNLDEGAGEADLTPLETVGYVDMYLYEFDFYGNLVPGTGSDYLAVLRFKDDGSVVLNPSGGNSPPSVQLLRNDEPLSGNVSTNEGESFSFIVKAEDANGDDISLTSPNANQLPEGAVLTGPTVNGNITQWSFNWTPTYEQDGTYPFTFTVSDGVATNSESLTIDVIDVNRPPNVSVSGPDTVNEGENIVLTIEATDADGDTMSLADATLPNLPEGAVLPTVPEIDGETYRWTFGWTPDFTQADTYPIDFTVTDGADDATAGKTITVVNVNLPPALDDISDQTLLDPESELVITITGMDEDATGLDLQYQVLSHASLPGTVNLDGPVVNGDTGVHTWTFRWMPGAGIADVYTIGFSVIETSGGNPLTSEQQQVVVTVGDTNAPPVLENIGARETVEAAELMIRLNASDPDVDQTLTYSVDYPGDMPDGHNAYLDDATGEFNWMPQPGAGQVGSHVYQLTFRVTDNGAPARSDEEIVEITLHANEIPGAPSINYPADGSQVDSLAGVELSVNNASDQDTRFGQILTYQFQVYTDPAMTPEYLFAETTVLVEEDPDETTEWIIPENLEENAAYYWRSRVFDGVDYSTWVEAAFTANTMNEPPGSPERVSPGNDDTVASTMPELMIQNAVDLDGDSLQYHFQVGDAEDIVNSGDFRSALVDEGNNHSGTNRTSWYVIPELADNAVYWWRAKAVDAGGAESDWIGPYPFVVDLANDAPSAPVLDPTLSDKRIYGGEVDTDRPKLIVANAVDPDMNAVLTYYFEIIEKGDAGCGVFEGDDLLSSPGIPEGQMDEPLPGGDDGFGLVGIGNLPQDPDRTAWRTPVLNDETHYCWRAWAEDEEGNAGPAVMSECFVNLENDLPSAAGIKSPLHMSRLGERMPTLEVYPAADSDEDRISYRFVLTNESGTKEYSKTLHDDTRWQVPEPLEDGVWNWRVKTFDEHADDDGMPCRWSGSAQFTVNINDLPGTPVILSPANGETITEQQPALRVQNATDEDGDALTYDFELYNDESLAGFSFIASGSVAEASGVTSWNVPELLADGMTYYWRVRAFDNEYYSSWSQTVTFKVDSSGGLMINVEASKQVFASADDEQVVEVKISDSPIYGVKVMLPPGSVPEDITLTIGYAQNPPLSDDEFAVIGKVLEFGPHGTVFNQPVTIQVPYTQEGLDAAGIADPQLLKVFNYIEEEARWEELAVSSVDEENRLINCNADHFSMYFFGIQRTATAHETSADGSSSGDGSCFVHVIDASDTVGTRVMLSSLFCLLAGVMTASGIYRSAEKNQL